MKKALTLLLALMLCVSLAAPALAAEPTSGECGENVTWSYSDGTLTISGTGDMDDFPGDMGPGRTPWQEYKEEIVTVVINDGVTRIGYGAFFYCTNLTSVTIPASIKIINMDAFYHCDALTDVYYGGDEGQWDKINISAENYSLQGATIHYNSGGDPAPTVPGDGAGLSGECGENVTWSYSDGTLTIQGTGDMYDYSNIKQPWNWMDSPDYLMFFEMKTLVIGDGVTSIGAYAFSQTYLENVIIGNSVTSIGEHAFAFGMSLKSVTIPISVTHIGSETFIGCSWITDIYYGGNESQWKQIEIDVGNYDLDNATIHYNSAAPAPSTSESIPVIVNGAAVAWTDAVPFIDANDRTMVPLRAVADAMRLEVNWDENTREASFTGSGKTITFPIDSSTARTSEGGTVTMDTAAVIVNERTYAPIRYLAEYFGYTVGWDDATRTVIITAG